MYAENTGTNIRNLVIIDFAGTLSLDTVLFSRDEMISRALDESGLTKLGVTDPGIFWNEVIGPTWEQGSTTNKGYVDILSRQIKEKISDPEKSQSDPVIKEAVSKFTQKYFAHSQIDPNWKPVFDYLINNNKAQVVVATDHYTEATNHIASELEKMGFKANPVYRETVKQKINIANSADLGFNKSAPLFWSALRKSLESTRFNWIIIIDDFGFNEQEEKIYGGKDKAHSRRDKTIAILKNVFQGELASFPFFLEYEGNSIVSLKHDYRRLIEQAHTFIKKHL